jgi:23S rRNA (uracil1939-C5)-methyltransferase
MAHKANTVTGVEIVEGAVACAKENARLNGIENAQFYCADASDTETIIPQDKEYDVVILDPPRKGTTPELISYIAKRKIDRVVYISCGPDTLARDVAMFKKYGYEPSAVQPVDMFPVTGHVESVVCLTRTFDN